MRTVASLSLLALLPVAAAAERADYLRQVKPLLARHCVGCHGPQKQRSGLRLDTAAAILKGGNSGPAAVPGNSGKSRLVQAVSGAGDVAAMPPKGPRLAASEIALLRAWIDAGAAAPAGEVEKAAKAATDHWAFRPLARPDPPAVRNPARVRNPIDRFVLARLEKEGIAPAAEADRTTLVRRLFLDLIGLPPSPKEIDDFLNDDSPDAWEKLVDRLLASPHYGERWGRHWLDLARYADSNGYSIDAPRSIWKYRDWVLDAFNRDLPFDRFVVEQIAGDLLPGATLEQRIATGFHRNTQINQEGGIDEEQFRVEAVVDRVNTTGTALLGLTVGCCQCHDHKFDPLSQREYYQLFAFFNSCDEPTLELASAEQVRRRRDLQAEIKGLQNRLRGLDTATPQRVAAWEGSLSPQARAMLPADVQAILNIAPNGRNAEQERAVVAAYRNAEQVRHVAGGLASPLPLLPAAHVQALALRRTLEQKIVELQRQVPVIPTSLVLQERKTPRTTFIHLGGDFLRKGAVVQPGTPAVLPPLTPNPSPPKTGARGERGPLTPNPSPPKTGARGESRPTRIDLARWFVDGVNPLPPRVTVNRFWQHYFGTGIVETENDFGTQGTPPSHPELLDWLATEFVRRGWSMKAMHRLIATSATYRQSSRVRPDLAVLDPRNRLLARQNRLRLDAEVVRDVALASSGLLCRKIGGPSVYPPQPPGVYQFTQIPRDWRASAGPDRYRRGLYTFWWRSAPHPDLIVFDAPDATQTCTRRNRSNTPLQALALLNDQGFFELAQGLAGRVLREGPSGDDERLTFAFRLCLGREPSGREREVLTHLLRQQREAFGRNPQEARQVAPARLPDVVEGAAWISVSRALFNLDEFITRE
jgi:mono/diheme cytochrome c family protein